MNAPRLTPTPHQAAALDRILRGPHECVLTGPAGTGKTTVLRWLIERLHRPTVLGTPTGKAATVLQEKTGRPARTIHSLLYQHVDESSGELVFGSPGPPCDPGSVLIVDEASMVGSRLYADVMAHLPRTARVIWVGDPEQVEPVKDTWGPDLRRPTAHLSEVHRQAADNPIIAYATAIREGRGAPFRRAAQGDDRLTFHTSSVRAVVHHLASRLRAGVDATAVTYTHRVREAVNAGIREALGFQPGGISPGDRLVCRMNSPHLGMMNGEVFTVAKVVEIPRPTPGWLVALEGAALPILVPRRLLNDRSGAAWEMRRKMDRDTWEESCIVPVWHGQCLTVHSAQGSQWEEVLFAWGHSLARADRESARRLSYTAVTRAAERLSVWDVR